MKKYYETIVYQYQSVFGIRHATYGQTLSYSQRYAIDGIWSTLIWCNVMLIIGTIALREWFLGLVMLCITNAVCFLAIGFLKIFHKLGFIVIIALLPITSLVIMIKQIYKCLKKLFIRSAGA